MPKHAPLALALAASLVLALASPAADAQRKSRAPATPPGPSACTDFDAYANQAWLSAHPVPATGAVTALGQLQARTLEQQRELLTSAMNAPQNDVQRLLGDFWASGLDQAAVHLRQAARAPGRDGHDLRTTLAGRLAQPQEDRRRLVLVLETDQHDRRRLLEVGERRARHRGRSRAAAPAGSG